MPPPADAPLWERRFRAATVGFPSWGRDAPDRLVYASNESGAHQLTAWDRASGRRRPVTAVAIGVPFGAALPDGSGIVWFDDETGDEVGRWVVQPWDAAVGDVHDLAPGAPTGWAAGLALGLRHIVVGVATAEGYAIHVDGALLHAHHEHLRVAGLSRDESIVCIEHAEHGDVTHPALRAVSLGGNHVMELWDGPGVGLHAAGFSPVGGDARLAFVHERSPSGRLRPGIWNTATGERRDLDDAPGLAVLEGDVTVAGWFPDGGALLLRHTLDGRDELFELDLDRGAASRLPHRPGTIGAARVRPDGDVWYLHSSGELAPSVRDIRGDVVVDVGEPAPPGHPYRSWHFPGPGGDTVHGFVVEPADRERPHPTVVLVHGGPNWLWADAWRPEVPAWVDHGFAVALVNYRGSTGYGPAWRDAINGDPGFPELADLVAGLDDLVASRVTDPTRVVLAGASWGGYLTLLGLGRHPERWIAGVAVVPVADNIAAFEDEAPDLQAVDRVLFGGTPDDLRDRYEERSPITYAESVVAPVLVIAGDNDTRCPMRQVLNYVARLEQLGKEHALHRFDAGHGSMVIGERVDHMRRELEFVLRRVPT